jgi:hypothetical protein
MSNGLPMPKSQFITPGLLCRRGALRHYWGRGSAEDLASGFRAALEVLGK